MAALRRPQHHPDHDLAEMVDELTRPHDHREHYTVAKPNRKNRKWEGRNHLIRVPSLLHQLAHATPQNITGDDRPGGAGFESKPAAHLDAVDALTRVDRDTIRLLATLGLQPAVTAQETTADRVRLLHRLLAIVNPGQGRAITRAITSWYTHARVVTGWDEPAWRPASTCPACTEHGTLRIRRPEKLAACVHCGETWDPWTIGLLADHIRLEADLGHTARRTTPEPCWCPWPQPQIAALHLCPTCGTARCHRALTTSDTPTTAALP